jgi:hypothetical protein
VHGLVEGCGVWDVVEVLKDFGRPLLVLHGAVHVNVTVQDTSNQGSAISAECSTYVLVDQLYEDVG